MNTTRQNRIRRHQRVRAKITGTASCPRVAVFRSNRHLFIQVIDDQDGKTIISNQINGKEKTKGTKTEVAAKIGETLAAEMKKKGIEQAVFDRGGFKYHGRVKALADGIRNGGIRI